MADNAQAQVALWRATHPTLQITEAALLTMAPFASLYASDFLVYAERKGINKEAVDFFRSMHRELVWVYGLWQQAQRDADTGELFRDILTAAKPGGGEDGQFYTMIHKFLRDYALANNIALDDREEASWETAFSGSGITAPVAVEGDTRDAEA